MQSGVNDTADNLLAAIKSNEPEIAPSTIFAVASILEGSVYINGSPQNTFTPGVIALAEQHDLLFGPGPSFLAVVQPALRGRQLALHLEQRQLALVQMVVVLQEQP